MAVIESKRSLPSAQPTATTPTRKHRSSKRATAKPNRKKREKIPPSLRCTVTKRGKTTIRRYPDAASTALKKPKASQSTTSSSSPLASTTRLTSPLRTRPLCTSSSSPALPWKPNTPTGRPATGVASNAGRPSAARPSGPDFLPFNLPILSTSFAERMGLTNVISDHCHPRSSTVRFSFFRSPDLQITRSPDSQNLHTTPPEYRKLFW